MGFPFYGGFWSKHLILMSVSNPYWSLSRVFSIFFTYLSGVITIGYSIKALLLIIKNSSLITSSNYKYNIFLPRLYKEILPTLFLSIFVIFFPSVYLFFSNIRETYLILPLSVWDFFLLFLRGLILMTLIIKPRSFNFVFSWRRNYFLALTSSIKILVKFMRRVFLERSFLKKRVKKKFSFWNYK
jgi:hypothetical protein